MAVAEFWALTFSLIFSRFHTCDLWFGARSAVSGGAYKGRAPPTRSQIISAAAFAAPDGDLRGQLLAEPFEGAGPPSHFRFVEVLPLA
jgi:hypothetical protein